MDLFRKFEVPCPQSALASTVEEVEAACKTMPGPDYVVKAMVLAGGRGKGRFKNSGLQGGVQLVHSVAKAQEVAGKMLGDVLVTKQTGAVGKPVNQILITNRLYFRREAYFGILMDRAFDGPVMVASPSGGMDIEAVAAATPELIFKEPVDIEKGPSDEALTRLAVACGFDMPHTVKAAKECMRNLYKLFDQCDSTLVEINPLCETHDNRVLCADGKVNLDDNAAFRQGELFGLRDESQEDPREVQAAKWDLNYIGLDGSIGCLVNGAGLAMATMDAIKLYGGEPANFLDMGGGANEQQVTQAFHILDQDPQVQSILVNIFGGIMRCDVIALGMIKAVLDLGIKKPIVVRLEGTNVTEATKLIEDSGLRMVVASDLGDAAKKAVRVTKILDMAKLSDLGVNFELPI